MKEAKQRAPQGVGVSRARRRLTKRSAIGGGESTPTVDASRVTPHTEGVPGGVWHLLVSSSGPAAVATKGGPRSP